MSFQDRTVFVEEESAIDLIRDLRDESLTMIRQEIELAKAEASEKISSAVKNSVFMVVWSFVLYAGFLFLLAGLTFLGYSGFVAAGLSPAVAIWLMPLITAVIVLAVGGIGLWRAYKKLTSISPVPEKTIHTLKEDQRWLKKEL